LGGDKAVESASGAEIDDALAGPGADTKVACVRAAELLAKLDSP
jgi:hypothetical protein